MTKTSKNMKGYYRQKKKNNNNNNTTKGSITKSKSLKTTKNRSFDSDNARTSFDHKDDFDEEEQVLRQYDMNMAYGPCLGITRLARWERAQRLGLTPPEEIGDLLKDGKVKLESLLDGRV